MKLPELKELAKQLGLRGVSTMRKGDLIATLQAARSGGEAPAGVTVRAPKVESAAAQNLRLRHEAVFLNRGNTICHSIADFNALGCFCSPAAV